MVGAVRRGRTEFSNRELLVKKRQSFLGGEAATALEKDF